MAKGIEEILAGANGEMVREAKEDDRRAAARVLGEEQDPLTTGVSKPDTTGNEYGTSDLADYEPNDQEQDVTTGPATKPVPGGEGTGELVQAPTAAHADAMAILNQQIAALDAQNVSDEDDPAMAQTAWPPTPGNEGEVMPGGGEPYEISDSQRTAGSLLDQLQETRGRVRRRRTSPAVRNQGQIGNPIWDQDDGPDSVNPYTADEAPEHYLDGTDPASNPSEYPTAWPEYAPNEVGPAPQVSVTPGPSVESIKVRQAVDNILEGHDPEVLASRLIGG